LLSCSIFYAYVTDEREEEVSVRLISFSFLLDWESDIIKKEENMIEGDEDDDNNNDDEKVVVEQEAYIITHSC
jgi:hypothetical protein